MKPKAMRDPATPPAAKLVSPKRAFIGLVILLITLTIALVLLRPKIPFITGGRKLDERLTLLSHDIQIDASLPGSVSIATGRNVRCWITNTDGTNAWRRFGSNADEEEIFGFYDDRLRRRGWAFDRNFRGPASTHGRIYHKEFRSWDGRASLSVSEGQTHQRTISIFVAPIPDGCGP